VWITSVLIGKTRAGRPVTIAKLPVGAPATAILLEMAIARGVRDILVCGSAGSLQQRLPIGSIVVISAAEREDGTSHHYVPAGEAVAADPKLSDRLAEALGASGAGAVRGRSWTIDAVFRETAGAIARHQRAGVAVVDMESAAIFAVAQMRGARAAIAVAVSDELFRPWTPGFHLPAFHAGLERVADGILQVADAL
jgi:uridine phosphorylase